MVNQPVRIGIVGTHATGKTTLMRRIEMELRAEGITVARTGGLAKRAAALGLPKMSRHTARSTEWIITAGTARDLAAATHACVVLADRHPADALAYYLAALDYRQEQPDPSALGHLRRLVTNLHRHNLLFATVLDPDEPTPTGHDYDPTYRALVDQHTRTVLADLDLGHVTVSNDDASRKEAIRLALHTVHSGVSSR